jgi:hypothetical protein
LTDHQIQIVDRGEEIRVAEMARCSSIAPLGSEFDAFLFASIGDDGNKLPLRVVSALARLDFDPWQEADALARLPRDAAIARLTSWIATLPDTPVAQLDPRTIAARLVALLPRQGGASVLFPAKLPSAGERKASRTVSYAFLIFMALLLCAQLFASTRLSQTLVDGASAPASGTVAPEMPGAGQ